MWFTAAVVRCRTAHCLGMDSTPPDTRARGSGLGLLRMTAVAIVVVLLGVGVALVYAGRPLGPDVWGQPVGSPRAGATVNAPDSPTAGGSREPGATPDPSAPPAASATPGASPPPSPSQPGQQFGFGGHLMWHDVESGLRQLDMLREDGLEVIRFDVAWRDLEPSPGQFRYLDKLDSFVTAAQEDGIRSIITVIETPAWANGGRSRWVPPDDPADYARFLGVLASRYAGRVMAWEVWNEPDLELFWRPRPNAVAYTRLLVAASAAIRQADPSALVFGGSIAFGNTDFVRTMYAEGARGTFDAMAIHPYTLTRAPEDETDRFHSLTAVLDDMRAIMVEEGDAAVPIWVTEFGWAIVGLNSVSREQRVEYLPRAVRIIRERPWVAGLVIYTIDTRDSARYGLSSSGDRSAAWRAYVDAVRSGG